MQIMHNIANLHIIYTKKNLNRWVSAGIDEEPPLLKMERKIMKILLNFPNNKQTLTQQLDRGVQCE